MVILRIKIQIKNLTCHAENIKPTCEASCTKAWEIYTNALQIMLPNNMFALIWFHCPEAMIGKSPWWTDHKKNYEIACLNMYLFFLIIAPAHIHSTTLSPPTASASHGLVRKAAMTQYHMRGAHTENQCRGLRRRSYCPKSAFWYVTDQTIASSWPRKWNGFNGRLWSH